MVSGLKSNYISAYHALLTNVPELREKIATGNIVHKDILKIGRSVIVKEKYDGSFHVSKNRLSKDRNFKVENDQIELIKKICSQYNNIPHRRKETKQKPEVTHDDASIKKEEAIKKSDVKIIRKKTKKSSCTSDDSSLTLSKETSPTINHKVELKDFFNKDAKIPDSILGLVTEYIKESPQAIVDFAKDKRLPWYLKDITELNLSHVILDYMTFCNLLCELKSLHSLKLPKNANDLWIAEVIKKLPGLKTLEINGNEKITDAVLIYIAENMTFLEKLVITNCMYIQDESIDYVIQKLQNLKELSILYCSNITGNAFVNIEKMSETLRSLHLSGIKITDDCLIKISTHVKNLQTLSLILCKEVTDNGLDHLIQNLNQLKHLKLEYCEISDYGVRNIGNLSESLEELVISNCKNIDGWFLERTNTKFKVLKELRLNQLCSFTGHNFINCNETFSALEILDLSNNENLSSKYVENIVQGASNLKDINLNKSNGNIGDEALKCIADNCSSLACLSVKESTITNLGINHIAKHCKGLLYLDLSSCYEIDDEGLKGLADNCHKLYRLSLNNCKKITDVGLSHISTGCPNMIILNLNGCIEITDSGILSLSQDIKELQALSLKYCLQISSAILSYVSKWNNSMFALELSNCKTADKDFVDLEAEFPNLTHLSISYTDIGDLALSKFAKLFPSLTDLEIEGCLNVTDAGAAHIAKISNISNVSVDGCAAMTYDGVDNIRNKGATVNMNVGQGCVIS